MLGAPWDASLISYSSVSQGWSPGSLQITTPQWAAMDMPFRDLVRLSLGESPGCRDAESQGTLNCYWVPPPPHPRRLAVPVSPTGSVEGAHIPTFLPAVGIFQLSNFCQSDSLSSDITIALYYISLISNHFAHAVTCLRAFWFASSVNCLFIAFAYFALELFLSICMSSSEFRSGRSNWICLTWMLRSHVVIEDLKCG